MSSFAKMLTGLLTLAAGPLEDRAIRERHSSGPRVARVHALGAHHGLRALGPRRGRSQKYYCWKCFRNGTADDFKRFVCPEGSR